MSDQLDLFEQDEKEKAMEKELEPKFREAAMDFRDQKHSFQIFFLQKKL